MPIFNDSENVSALTPPGDHIFTVTDFEIKLSTGAKTNGSEAYEVELTIEHPGGISRVWEQLIDHPSTGWKIDCFLKSSGIRLAKGEAFDFRQDIANARGIKWIDPIGLRGWCSIFEDHYAKRSDAPGQKTGSSSKVGVFYTDREKLPRVAIAATQTEDENAPFV